MYFTSFGYKKFSNNRKPEIELIEEAKTIISYQNNNNNDNQKLKFNNYKNAVTNIQPSSLSSSIGKILDQSKSRRRLYQLSLMGLCIAFYVSAENGYLSFSSSMLQMMNTNNNNNDPSTFQHQPLSTSVSLITITATQAAHIQSLMSTAYTIGRLITALISLHIRIDHILTYHYLIQFGALGTLFWVTTSTMINSDTSLTLIYAGSAALGFGFSAIFPGMFAFTEQNLGLTDRVGSFYVCLVGSVALVIPLMLSQLFHLKPHLVLMSITGTFCMLSFVIFLVVRSWITLTQTDKNKSEKKKNFYEDLS